MRYPVEIRNESVTDEQVTRKVLAVIQSEPEVQAAVVGIAEDSRGDQRLITYFSVKHWRGKKIRGQSTVVTER